MIMLDMRTVIVGNVIVSAIAVVVLLQLWLQNRAKYAGLHLWVADWVLQFIGTMLIALRGTVPIFASAVLGNGMIVGGALVLYFGLRRFVGKQTARPASYALWLWFCVFLLVHSYFTLVVDSLPVRSYNTSVGLSFVCLLSAKLLLRGVGPDLRRISRDAGFAFALVMGISILRLIGFTLLPATDNDFLHSGSYDTMMVALLTGAIVFLVFSLVLMVNRRLYAEVKRTGEELRETSEYLNNLLDYANAPIIVWNPQFRITRFNRAFERLVGLDARDVVGKQLDMLFPEGSRTTSLASIRETAEGEYWQSVEIPVQHQDGSVRTVLWNSANLHDLDGKTVLATIAQGHDITIRKRLEAQLVEANGELRSLAARLEVAREEERGAVAWELHDHVAQALSVLKADMDSCRRKLDADELARITPTLEGMTRLLDETVERLRRLYADLVPVMLEDLGLAAAIEWQAEEFARRSGMACEVRQAGDIDLPRGRVALGMFRVLQEALDNAQRHSGATKITVDLERTGADAVMRVRDNGRGFGGDDARKPGTVGLTGIRERAQSWGGSVTVDSSPGGGMVLEVTAPLTA